ncbi:MAG: fibrobacter succinogenes major paralogous domain-containing protein [Chitinophagales bacterium]|nr:fibrobacter succinogenes major paralogous domain-containing protein [Chitinophagales bacterium]
MKKNNILFFIIITSVMMIASACKKDKSPEGITINNPYLNPSLTYGNVTDIDGNKYATIQIGNQVWMADNLRTTRYNDGTPVPNITNNSEWSKLTTGAYVYYNNDASHNATYGKLYNWYAVNTGKLCPQGWHVPTDTEWTQMSTYLGTNVGGKLKATGNTADGTGLWILPNSGATNESGFTGLPGGYRGSLDGKYNNMGNNGYWWSSTEYTTGLAWGRDLDYSNSTVGRNDDHKRGGFSCRCVRD